MDHMFACMDNLSLGVFKESVHVYATLYIHSKILLQEMYTLMYLYKRTR